MDKEKRKLKPFILIVLFGSLIAILIIAGNDYLKNKNAEKWQKRKIEICDVNMKLNIPQIISEKYYWIVQKIGNVDNREIIKAESALLEIPTELVKSFIDNGWNIYITTEDLNQKYFNGKYNNVYACSKPYEKWIKIKSGNINKIKHSVKHEFGHYLNFISGNVSKSEEFHDIYEEEEETFKSQISMPECVFNENELFAEEFYYYINDSSKCTPKAKEYIERYMEMLTAERDN